MTEEATLLKAFKFFDLQNSGNLSKNEFFRGLAKVGVVPELQVNKIFVKIFSLLLLGNRLAF